MKLNLMYKPFCPDSRTASDQLLEDVSNAPPTEETDPAVDGRRG
jgi:hypothetical protein